MKESFELKEFFNATPSKIYTAWLSSKEHSEMTGGEASCSDKTNDPFTTWDDYITGTNKSLKANEEIVQNWRTTEFNESDEDSLVTIQLKKVDSGCELTLTHINIPKGQTQYKQGWIEHYFTPMKEYFK
jgi:activator of HSP90 ATPase